MEKPLNITAEKFCARVGISHSSKLMENLRALKLVTFFNVGRKKLYASEDADKLSDLLRRGEYSIQGGGHVKKNINSLSA